MQETFRQLSDSLADLLALDRRQPIRVILGAVIGLIALDWFGSSLREIAVQTIGVRWVQFISLALLPILVVYLTVLIRRRARKLPQPVQPIDGRPPPPARGAIVLLSSFRTFSSKLPGGRTGEVWASEDLIAEVDAAETRWPTIMDHVMASNMQIPIEAIKYHHDAGTLEHVWVISTAEVRDANGVTVSVGSSHLGKTFERIVREGFGMVGVTIHHQEPYLHVAHQSVEESFSAVNTIFVDESQRANLQETDIVADITGGTTTMKMGMLLAAGLVQRPLQFTATQTDPVYGNPLERPEPYSIALDNTVVRKMVLEHLLAEQEV